MKTHRLTKVSKTLMFITAAVMLVVGVVLTNGCKKDLQTDKAQQPMVDDASEAVVAHILEFKERMAYYHENPNLKTGGQLYSASEAVIELESLLNYNFCYTDIQCNEKKFVTSEVIMPLDELEKINDPKLMEVYYDRAIDTIQAQMGRINFSNMKLLMVDLEVSGMDSNGDAIISIGALIGNEGTLTSPSAELGWWYGYWGGDCSATNPNQGIWDAANELQETIRVSLITAPPPGYVRRTNLVYTEDIIQPNQEKYRTENDAIDNFLDYKIFYASNASPLQITDTERCVSSDVEIPHYLTSYTSVINSVREEQSIFFQTNLSFLDCIVEGETTAQETYIQHHFMFQLGNSWLVPEGSIEIDNILVY